MGLPLPKTPIIGMICQILAFLFGILCMVPGPNGVLENAYIISLNTSAYGRDALATSNMFALNQSNPLFAVATSVHPDFEHMETPPAIKGLTAAINKRLEINMSDPKTVKGIYDTPLRDVIKGGKDLINSDEGQFKIASGMSDFLAGMAAKMSGKAPQSNAAPPAPVADPGASPQASGHKTRLLRRADPAATPNDAAPPTGAAPVVGAPPPNGAVVPMGATNPGAPANPNPPVTPNSLASSSDPIAPNRPIMPASASSPGGPAAPNSMPLPQAEPKGMPQAAANCSCDAKGKGDKKGDGQPFGPPKPKLVIPPEGPWTPLKEAIKEHGPIISAGIKHGAIQAMNHQLDEVHETWPIYDFYSIYNVGYCFGHYTADGSKTVACGSSADWKDIDMAPRVQVMLNKFVSPNTKIVGPMGLGDNMERFLGAQRVLMMIMYVNKIMTVVNQFFAMAFPILGVIFTFGGCLPPHLHLKLSFINFAMSAAAAGMVAGGTMSVLGMLLMAGVMMPPMNAMMSVDLRLGIPYIMLCLVDSIFAVIGAVCWYRVWRMMVKGAKQAEEEKKRGEERGYNSVEVIEVKHDAGKAYDDGWVKG